MNNILWLLPVIFMFHDFEEIIFFESWISKLDYNKIETHLPLWVSSRIKKSLNNFNTVEFCKSVFTLYLILIVCTLLTQFFKPYLLWFALLCFFTIHLFFHCLQATLIRSYVPGLYTSIICIPICIFLIDYSYNFIKTDVATTVVSIIIVTIIGITILFLLEKKRTKSSN